MRKLLRHREFMFIFAWSLVFFVVYAGFNLAVINPRPSLPMDNGAVKFSSPDEAANYFWISRFAAGEPLYYIEESNAIANGLVHLRGLNTLGVKVLPGSFLGLPLIYGALAKIFTPGVIPFLTPFFACLGLVFFYLLISKIFKNRPIGLIAAVLLSFFPGWFYYASRGMYHNVLFISLLIASIYLLLVGLEKLKLTKSKIQDPRSKSIFKFKFSKLKIYNLKLFIFYFLSGFILGLAIITRTSEIVWVALLILFIFIINFRKIYWPGLALFVAGLVMPIVILMYQNLILYGSLISVGYQSVLGAGGIGRALKSGILFQILVSPFGFSPRSIAVNSYNYLIKFFPYWTVPAIIGAIVYLILPKRQIQVSYSKRFVLTAYGSPLIAYLLIFYGSWQFTDRIDENVISLGTSYLRYWLPIFVASLPLTAFLIYTFTRFIIPKKFKYFKLCRPAVALIIILALFIPSINLTLRRTDESLFLLTALSQNRVKAGRLSQIISANDIVVLSFPQADKIFFSEHKKIITALVNDADYAALKNLVKTNKVYYYTFADANIVAFVSRRDFEPCGMIITDGQPVLGNEWIYKIIIN